MFCEKCSGMVTLSAMSTGICEKCGKEINNDNSYEICEVCGKEIPEGTGDEFLDRSCGYKFWLCDECIDDGDYY